MKTSKFSLFLFLLTLLQMTTTQLVAAEASVKRNVRRDNEPVEHFVKRLFHGYENLFRPVPDNNATGPTEVKIFLVVDNFGEISVQDMSYSIHLYLNQYWKDSRLQYSNYPDNILLNSMRDRLWLPDLYLPRAIGSSSFTMKSKSFSLWLQSDGKINYSQMVTLRLSCPMYLYTFPLDEQLCPLQIGSYAYRDTEIQLNWLYPGDPDKTIVMSRNITLNEFNLVSVMIESFSEEWASGNFTYVNAKFIFSRKLGFYMLYTYLPTMLIIAVCWLSFFVDFKAAPARISLSLLSVLSLITQSSATIQKLPRVSYTKAIDVWIFSSLAFVVVSLIEFALINSLCREENKSLKKMLLTSIRGTKAITTFGNRPRNKLANGETANDDSDEDKTEAEPRKKRMVFTVETGYTVDKLFRIIFPVAFGIFNIFYWTYYSHPIHEPHITA